MNCGGISQSNLNLLNNKIKVGHAGTLDPNATGVLPILIGNATKISKYLIEHKKTYIAEIKLGIKTNTGDAEGQIVEKKSVPELSNQKVETILKQFLGKQKQVPSIYSAIKINGKKAYEYARNGQDVNIQEREIEIYDIKLKSYREGTICFEVSCSKGTYIRTLSEDIAESLGTVGYMENLERIKVNDFELKDAITIEEIKSNLNIIENCLISIEEIFKNNKKINVNDYKLKLFLNGVKLTVQDEDGIYKIYNQEKFIGLGIVKNNLLKRDVIV